jgi:hypothetical protein
VSKFTYNDIVCIKPGVEPDLQHGRAWVVGIFEERLETWTYFDKFPAGVVYTIEFEDGSSAQVHEGSLELHSSHFEDEPPVATANEGRQRQSET